VILPDVNLLLHAYNRESPRHDAARAWWEGLMNGSWAWVAILGFVRISTHRQILSHPLPVEAACALAIEHQAEIHSTDADFRRFPGLRWSNPLA
jgi:predicted nucleic acid-binding protein